MECRKGRARPQEIFLELNRLLVCQSDCHRRGPCFSGSECCPRMLCNKVVAEAIPKLLAGPEGVALDVSGRDPVLSGFSRSVICHTWQLPLTGPHR